MPVWCETPSVSLDGKPVPVETDENGFLCVHRTWDKETTLTLTFPMIPRVEERIDRNAKQLPMPDGGAWGTGTSLGMYSDDELSAIPCADVVYGPLLFVYPIPEQDENSAIEGARWQYAIDPARTLEKAEVIRSEMVHPWGWPVDSPVKIRVNAIEADWVHDTAFPHLPTADEMTIGEKREITLVPYGCAKLRVSLFPIVKQ